MTLISCSADCSVPLRGSFNAKNFPQRCSVKPLKISQPTKVTKGPDFSQSGFCDYKWLILDDWGTSILRNYDLGVPCGVLAHGRTLNPVHQWHAKSQPEPYMRICQSPCHVRRRQSISQSTESIPGKYVRTWHSKCQNV